LLTPPPPLRGWGLGRVPGAGPLRGGGGPGGGGGGGGGRGGGGGGGGGGENTAPQSVHL